MRFMPSISGSGICKHSNRESSQEFLGACLERLGKFSRRAASVSWLTAAGKLFHDQLLNSFRTRQGAYAPRSPKELPMWVVLLLAGCGTPAAPPTEPPPPPAAEEVETWYLVQMDGKKVGVRTQTVREVEHNGERLRQTEVVDRLEIQRFGDTARQEMRVVTRETLDGEPRAMEYLMQLGQTPQHVAATVAEGQVTLRRLGGAAPPVTQPWPAGTQGYFGVEDSLRRQPMKPGERRQVRLLLPLFDQIAAIELEAGRTELTETPDGPQLLLKIVETIPLPDGQKLTAEIWTDERGEVVKHVQAPLTIVRTTKERALAASDAAAPDLGLDVIVPLDRPLPSGVRRAVFRATLADGDPSKLFASSAGQQVERLDERTARVTVEPLRPGVAVEGETPPTPADLAPSSLVESDHAAIQQFAEEAVGQAATPWEKATALEKFVQGFIEKKDYTQAFATAAEVASSRSGDCTEHAVLLAALCRAQNIPCRAAMGLVYLPAKQGFAYHMWNEVWVDGAWIALDATQGRSGVAADHLKLAHTSLEGPAAYTRFLPVLQALNKLQLQVLEAE